MLLLRDKRASQHVVHVGAAVSLGRFPVFIGLQRSAHLGVRASAPLGRAEINRQVHQRDVQQVRFLTIEAGLTGLCGDQQEDKAADHDCRPDKSTVAGDKFRSKQRHGQRSPF